MVCNLREFKEFIDNEMIVILGQMDSPTEIFEHVYLVRTYDTCDEFGLDKTTLWFVKSCCFSISSVEYIYAHLDTDWTCDVSRALSGMPLTWRSCRTAGKTSDSNLSYKQHLLEGTLANITV